MRLWHQSLIPYLSTKRLVRQHCECCGLRGKGWGRKHATVDYVFKHSFVLLYKYHLCVMLEMKSRGYKFDEKWLDLTYRGKELSPFTLTDVDRVEVANAYFDTDSIQQIVYPEHNKEYLEFCLKHLDEKGEHIEYDLDNISEANESLNLDKMTLEEKEKYHQIRRLMLKQQSEHA